MCRRIQCPQCGRPGFAGCGQHVEQVLGDVPRAERCLCREKKSASAAQTEDAVSPLAWVQKLFTR